MVVTYRYDPWGNMLEKVTYAHTTEETLSDPVKTVTYTYGNPDWQDELTEISTVTGADTVSEQIVYDNNGNAVSVNHNGTDYYYLRNGQNDIVALIDDTGAKVAEYVYNSWGEVISLTGPAAATIGTLNPFRYRGYVYDEETGLYYLQSRYYDPEICRFLSSDVLLSTGQGVIGNNSFAYCGNQPVNGMDSDGYFNCGGFWTGAALATLGVVCVAISIATYGTSAPLMAAFYATASSAILATGVVVAQSAATDSTMVMDLSASVPLGPAYFKGGASVVLDFSEEEAKCEVYAHSGGGFGKQRGITYSVGKVENYSYDSSAGKGNYGGPFVDMSVNTKVGFDFCYGLKNDEKTGKKVRARSIVFDAFASGCSFGRGKDEYCEPYRLF